LLVINQLHIENFKNLTSVKTDFNSRIVCFCGENGAGKTNLLDAIYYLSFGKSYFNGSDSKNIKHEENYFNLRAKCLLKNDEYEIFIAAVRQGKKKIKINQQEYERLADHVGRFPLVIITPYDLELIDNGSIERRRFIDRLIAQTNSDYLNNLIRYEKALMQRNASLKWMKDNNKADKKLIEPYNVVLAQCASLIYQLRVRYIEEINSNSKQIYHELSGKNEFIDAIYESQLNTEKLENLLNTSFDIDVAMARTTSGIHRDDIVFRLNNHPAQHFASQGQKKSLVVSLKFAEYNILKNEKGFKPVLLLDDLSERLDPNRTQNLVQMIASDNFGQVFMTDTVKDKMINALDAPEHHLQVLEIKNGQLEL